MKHLRMVEVEWVDSNATWGWEPITGYKDGHVSECRTAGYLVKSTRKELMVGLSVDYGSETMNCTMTIPRCSVKKIRYLEAKE